ncbi:MAG: DUF3772 domain-containing protein [Caulobacteraceae bacterium]|nr:DUF3772 domain-containing protein [Caulobacteraceae bacterium]
MKASLKAMAAGLALVLCGVGAAQAANAPAPAVPSSPRAATAQGAPQDQSAARGTTATSAPAPAAAAKPGPAPTPVPPTPASPPAAAPPPDAAATLIADQAALQQLQNQAQTTSADNRLAAMGAQAAAIQAQANQIIAARTTDLAKVVHALNHLPHRRLTAAQRAEEAQLIASRASLTGQLRQAQSVASGAGAAFSAIAERRREGFSARVLEQSASPLSPDFWDSLQDAADADASRLMLQAQEALDTAVDAPEPRAAIGLIAGILLALAILFPLRRWLEGFGRRKAAEEGVPHGLSATIGAIWIVAVDTGLPGLAAGLLHLIAQWARLLSNDADAIAGSAVVAVTWAAAIIALGRALGTDRRADRRLLGLSDTAAERVRPAIWTVAVITACGFLLTRLIYVVGASVAATIAVNCLLALAYAAVAGLILFSFGKTHSPEEDRAPEAPPPDEAQARARSSGWTLVSLALTVAIIATVGAVLSGYTTLAALISSQIFWLSILAAVAYLLLRLIDDVCEAMFRTGRWAARSLALLFNLRPSTISQIGVLLSATLQLIVIVCTISLALTPFGQSGGLLLGHLSQLGRAIHIGSVTISPMAVVAGLATLVVGTGLAHLVQGWVDRRYLPVTDWDSGLRNSVSTGVGYLGVGVALVCAFAAMGLGFQQIALIASALSVGIGFGLQQIVQNFVSGVILLVERPVKVGDWVNVEGVEGDIRRIRVRATEIQTFDRSTIIVPNSDLITKPVQNKTLGEPRGRIQLQLSIAKPSDVRQATALIQEVAKAKTQVLKQPPPAVYIDGVVAGGATTLNCFFYVASPRDVYRTRSELYADIFDQFEQHAIAL